MQNYKTTSQAIFREIQTAKKILLVSHQKPDGDTLGANFALATYLLKIGKEVDSFCFDQMPTYLKFLPQSDLLNSDHLLFTKQYDLIITVDCSNLELTGVKELINLLPQPKKIINIDHHVSNPFYGDINLVINNSSSTCEIIYRLFKDWRINWNQAIAQNLACGIITDTSGLKNPSTNYQAVAAISDLINKGANINKIIKNTLQNIKLSQLKLWGRALERLTKSENHQLVYTWLTRKDYQECEASEEDSEGLSNFLHILKEGEIILVLKESLDGFVRGSLRTTSNIDLTKLAELFGGGGHKKAAGFSLPGKLAYDNNRLRII